eukprot:jgi/Ulvmu1/9621/UM054_0051.1
MLKENALETEQPSPGAACHTDVTSTPCQAARDWPFFRAAVRLGMSQEAPDSWANIYVRPDIVRQLYFSASIGCMAVFAALFIPGFQWFAPMARVPIIIFLVVQTARQGWFRQHGPAFAGTKPARIGVSIVAASLLTMSALAFAGPDQYVPYGNRVITLIGVSLAAFFVSCAAGCGGVAADHPYQPHKSLLGPLINATFSTLRLMDALTDMTFVRILATQGPT